VCGRFTLYSDPDRYAARFQAQPAPDVREHYHASWNVAPQSTILGVRERHGRRQLELFSWGLVPSWAKDASGANRTFNARAESVAVRVTYRAAFRQRRLLVPADGFYEWTAGADARKKVPHYFTRRDGQPLALAGLWEFWSPPEGGIRLSATIITTTAGSDLDGIHDRQPAILEPDTWDRWLDPSLADRRELEGMLRPGVAGVLQHWQVSPDVGNVRNDSERLIATID
jgi:putative SOS response-associated peptidase YedK